MKSRPAHALKLYAAQSNYYSPDDRLQLFGMVIDGLYLGLTRVESCQRAGINNQTLADWLTKYPEHAERYARARMEQAHIIADQALMIADERVNDLTQAARNRLRVDTRKWMASKLLPRVYGEKVLAEHSHRVGVVMLPAIPAAALPDAGPDVTDVEAEVVE